MEGSGPTQVVEIEILQDLSATSRCDEGFLQVRRLLCQNRRADGSTSRHYRVDVVDRPFLDAVAVLVYRRRDDQIEVLTRQNLRPAAYFRRGKETTLPDQQHHLRVEEIVAGLLEPGDKGEPGLRSPFFAVPGVLSEKIYITAVDVTGKAQTTAVGDGSPLEEGSELRWRPIREVLKACRNGATPDGKTEIAISRFLTMG